MYPGVIYLSIWEFDGVEYQGGVETEAGGGDTDEQPSD